MHRLNKEKVLLAFVVASLILFAFMLLVTTNTITNVSGVETESVGVYWDSKCTKRIFSIDWGTLTPGSTKSIVVYIRNEVEERIYLIMSTTNWNPSKASDYITLRWNYTGQRINPGEALQITLTLSISRQIEGITSFSFDILVTGGARLLGDVDGSGAVDWVDLGLFGLAYETVPGDPNWNPAADFDNNGKVDWQDLSILGRNYGQHYS